jgi:hypothetical protein
VCPIEVALLPLDDGKNVDRVTTRPLVARQLCHRQGGIRTVNRGAEVGVLHVGPSNQAQQLRRVCRCNGGTVVKRSFIQLTCALALSAALQRLPTLDDGVDAVVADEPRNRGC